MELIIPREKLITDVLLRDDGCGCIMGHYLLACGIAPDRLIQKLSPREVLNVSTDKNNSCAMKTLFYSDTFKFNKTEVGSIMEVNDNKNIPLEQREEVLARLCKKYLDCDVTFTGNYPLTDSQ
jgi:hypothetical protein